MYKCKSDRTFTCLTTPHHIKSLLRINGAIPTLGWFDLTKQHYHTIRGGPGANPHHGVGAVGDPTH